MDTNLGKFDHNILIRHNLRASKIHVLDMQKMCSTIHFYFGVFLSNDIY